MTYLEERLKALNIDDGKNSFKAFNLDGHPIDFRFFTEKGEDISINYLTPDGVVEFYEEGRRTLDFSRIRIKSPAEGQGKYKQPPHTETIPFSTPLIINAFKHKEKLKTLYIIEGEFKAFALNNFDIPTMGIGGIHNFKGPSKDKLHPYIENVIKTCKVENVVLIFDADCLKIEWKENQELTTRLNTFYKALNNFNEYLKPLNVNLYFSHIVKESEYKGMDDLLYSGHCDQELVINELTSLISGVNERKYILTYLITGTSAFQIQRIFGLDSVTTFFENNKDILENKEFIYKGNPYYKDANGKLTVSWRGEQRNYIRVGTEYFKKVVDKSPNGQTEINIVKWNIGTIKADYYKSREFIQRITKCDNFTNIPDNNPDTYKLIVESEKDGIKSVLYNRYCPVSHVPVQGSWHSINKLLHHLFDYKNSAGDSLYEFALDYLQILYLYPVQKLPILCLISKERGTGKTTFLNLLRAIFVENMRILDSERISSKFNGAWAGKLIVAVDESLIDTDKPTVTNRIKMIATNPTIPLEEKGSEAREVPNFSKLIMCSNDESNFIKIDIEENRYCIIKVPAIPQSENNPHMLEIMKEEIPAFLFFLKNRTLYYQERSRLWFAEDVYNTPALEKIKERTENGLIKNIKDVIRQQFFYQQRGTIRLSLKVIYNLVHEQYRFADKIKIAEYLRDQGYNTSNATNFYYLTSMGNAFFQKDKDRCYTFFAEKFLTKEEIDGLDKEDKSIYDYDE